ncbi:SAM-dependent methyltransferase [Spirochaetia bacterium]|nr:SAM-dependent methyltransferase [Spirochaetia bacterium]GHU31357.1 SAM-dependent methyltransferase [Spirochaetia bacterium]
MTRIIVNSHGEDRILRGHPWVYDNEILRIIGNDVLIPGEVVDVESSHKSYLGRALANPHSKISARIFSHSKEGLDKGFFKRKIRESLERRSGFDIQRDSFRIIFGEADFLPGLIVDRFVGWPLDEIESALPSFPVEFPQIFSRCGPPRSWLGIQCLTFGMDSRRDQILEALDEVLPDKPSGVIEKSGSKVRELEGLEPCDAMIRGTFPDNGIVIFENNFPFVVPSAGQKTGHFLDQRENRRQTAHYAAGKTVLDLCCYTGAFAMHCARHGALSVTAVDASADALELVQTNARLNGVAIDSVKADVFDLLPAYQRENRHFDLIILDPPAFAKSHHDLDRASAGYKQLNFRAFNLLNPGGILITCSCSQAFDEYRFKAMITSAALDADRRIVQVDFRYQDTDHPILIGYGESLYLKCGVYRVL